MEPPYERPMHIVQPAQHLQNGRGFLDEQLARDRIEGSNTTKLRVKDSENLIQCG